ncbi:hypothetical protein ACFL6S_27490 [Candidatus Poribacteria bacterium]
MRISIASCALAMFAAAVAWTPHVATAVHGSEDTTTIEITSDVLVENTIRLGINTCGDNYWDSSVAKIRVAENFEGVRYRMVSWGPEQDENGIVVWFSPPEEAWEAMKGKVKYTLLGGPAKGTTGVIRDITKRKIKDGRELTYLVFDKQVPPSPNTRKNGIMLELDNLEQGSINETSNTEFWNAEQNTVSIGDVPPGSFGSVALWLRGAEEVANYTFVPMWGNQADQNGIWRVQFWAKAKSGQPTLRLEVKGSQNPTIKPDEEWQKHDLSIKTEDFPEGQSGIAMRFEASEGDVLLDDMVIWKDEEHKNPTPFRDTMVDVLKKLSPGILRHLQMGGSDLETNLRPRLEQVHWSRDFRDLVKGGRNRARSYQFNLHDYYMLCEHIGADPWYCVPGTLHPEEVNILMEYLGAPANVGYGKVRSELGHPKPWTEVFRNIYIEFGNEAWNPGGYATGSYNGPDHWRDMIEIGKQSPYYRPNVLFVAGSQAGNTYVTKSVLQDVPNADLIGIAPYLMNNTPEEHVEPLDTDDKLFRWVFGYTIRRVREPMGNVYQHYELTQEADRELATYEHNFHITNPKVADGGAPIETRNRIIASIGGGLNVINDALMMMKERHIRAQCLFNLNQKQFREGVKLWGFVPGLNYKDQRYRPSFHAMEIANKVIGGDLVETVHTGADPAFDATGVFHDTRRSGEVINYKDIPTLWSYAFRDEGRYGLVFFNMGTQKSHEIMLRFAGEVKDKTATAWWLSTDEISANNEYENGDPQVNPREEQIRDFSSGSRMTLPPFSMVAVQWDIE